MAGLVRYNVGPALLATAILLLPSATAWYQLSGGPDRNALALVPASALDVVEYRNLLAPDESMTTVLGPNFALTPDGLVGVARNESTGACFLLRVPTAWGEPARRIGLDGCRAPWFQGYDPLSDAVYICTVNHSNQPVFQARSALDGSLRWAITPRDHLGVVDDPLLFWVCSGVAFDFVRREAVAPFISAKSGLDAWHHCVASVDLDTGAINWVTQVPITSELTGGLVPTAQPIEGTGATFIPLSATLTSNGVVVTAVVICPDVITCDVPPVDGSRNPAPFQTAAAWLSKEGLVQGLAYSRRDLRSPTLPQDVTGRTAGGAFWASANGPLAVASLGGNMIIINPEAKDWLASAEVSTIEQAQWGLDTLAAPVWADDVILAPFYRTLTAFNAVDLSKRWAWATTEPGWLVQDLLVTPAGEVFVLVGKATRSSRVGYGVQGNESIVVRLDGRTGKEIQRLPVTIETWMTTEPDLGIPVLGEGFAYPRPPILVPLPDGLAVTDLRGHFVRIGAAEALRQPRVHVENSYPRLGDPLLLRVPPALPDPAQRVFVHWGDGFLDESALPEDGLAFAFRHTFAAPERHQVLVTAVYPDGLTGTTTTLVDVGGTPPPRLNLLQRAFAPENMDLTFGVLGILLAVMGGLYAGSLRLWRRTRLRRELQATEAVYESTRENPAACEAALDARCSSVHRLLRRGKIDEAQMSVLDRQIDDLRRTARLAPLDDRFDFLPRGLARRLERMLADGRVSRYEHDRFVAELDRDELLTRSQKAHVRRLIEGWRTRDAGART